MYIINRSIAIIRPKQPFLAWILSVEDDVGVTLEELRNDANVLLIPEYDSQEDALEYIYTNYENIFEMELEDWYTVEECWPENRSLKFFKEWFDVEIHQMIIDTVDGFIEKEEV